MTNAKLTPRIRLVTVLLGLAALLAGAAAAPAPAVAGKACPMQACNLENNTCRNSDVLYSCTGGAPCHSTPCE